MDRRTALAFGLMATVIIGFTILQNVLYPPKPVDSTAADSLAVSETLPVDSTQLAEDLTDRTPAGAQDTPPAAPVGGQDVVDGSPVSLAEALAVDQSGNETFIEVNTPLYTVKISSRGGRIVSWEGREHLSHDGNLVQLVPSEIPPDGSDALIFRMGEMPLGQANYRFQTSQESISVNERPVTLTLVTDTAGGLSVHKVYTFDPAVYGFTVTLDLISSNDQVSRETLNLLGTPEDFRFGWNQGIAHTERIQKMEATAMRSIAHVGDEIYTKKLQGLKKGVEKVEGDYRGSIHYAGVQNKYFTVFGIVDAPEGTAVEGSIRLGGNADLQTQSWTMDVPARRGTGTEVATSTLKMFIGPATVELVSGYGQDLTKGIDLGIRWIRPLSSLVLTIMNWMHKFIPNYGVIIILFSIATKLMFYPLSQKQTESMKKMQEIQPKVKALQEKFKNDKDKLNQATMKLYQEEGVNPLAGCLPLVVQMPVFFALYQGLSHTISLRGQPFVFWINDLSQPDALFRLPVELPLLGSDFNVLPILMALAMYYQGKVTPTSGGGGQMAAMTTMMPLFMVFIFYNMPSGLVLYWLVNTILQVYQSWKIHRAATHDGGAQTA